jgi:hypothetical protein
VGTRRSCASARIRECNNIEFTERLVDAIGIAEECLSLRRPIRTTAEATGDELR